VSSHEDIPWVSFRSPVDNGFYHARIQDVYDEEKPRMLRQTLFSPQNAADIFGIVANIPDVITLPVFETSTVDFSTYASLERIRDVRVEVIDDDTTLPMRQLSDTVYEFGPFSSIDPIPVEVTFIDPAANATSYSTSIDPYAPAISIDSAQIVDETLTII
jgi:hypothetical protein